MNERPKRRLFQFHLFTAIVLMFVAGGLMLLNCRQHEFVEYVDFGQKRYCVGRGWPWIFSTETTRFIIIGMGRTSFDDDGSVKLGSVFGDIGIAFTVLLVAGIMAEWLIRRREARRP